ncbi:NAC domain-containing protein 30 isoform X2 [Ricinus communis]|uniref:NAC domain-containing protein 30 isoform X2 n=1 Tax=Ricinus communis TaxID=3988 RepID=UPI000772824E|nr:NAC domain-containing protein 30 isoform X2 [Ricinus communis]|eukprot:XP_025012444.1 NAC domain-containing protein 30 isoform X2 [Ricinus communis]
MLSVPSDLPVGWRFHPTSEELLDHYLKNKRLGVPTEGSDIQEVQICNFDPWDLLDNKSPNEERYFFCRREFYLKTGRIKRKRKTGGGFWKKTGETQSVTPVDSDEEIGTKRIFVYHDPNPTKWVIHEYEYTAQLNSPVKGDFVLCKLMINKKANKKLKKLEQDSNNKKPNKKCIKIQLDYEKTEPREGVSNCNTASSSNIITAVSTNEDGQLSYSKNSLFQSQDTHQMTAVSIYNKTETNSTVHSDSKTTKPYEMDPVSTSFLIASDSEYPNSYEIDPSATSLLITSVSKSLNSYEIDPFIKDSSINEIDPSIKHSSISYDLKNTKSYEIDPFIEHSSISYDLKNTKSYEIDPFIKHSSISYDLKNTKSYEIDPFMKHSSISYDLKNTKSYEIDPCTKTSSISYNLEDTNSNPNVVDIFSTFNKTNSSCLMASSLHNQNPYELTYVSMHNKGETSCLMDSDYENNKIEMAAESAYENQDPSKMTYMSASVESEWRMFQEMPSDFENQNRYENTDMSVFQDNWGVSMAYNAQKTTFQKVENQHKKTDSPILVGYQGSLMAYDAEEAAFSEVDLYLLE